ncbi:MAG: siroheme decarboxylase subunit alpha [Candidatus Humimicrobiaceae bacterium]
MDNLDKKILDIIQQGIPVEKRPFLRIAEKLNLSETELIKRIQYLKEQGIIRRFGGKFDSQRLGYRSLLVAAKVPEKKLVATAEILNRYTGVTHNYQRNHSYNLWFTLTASSERRLYKLLEIFKQETGIDEMIPLPALKKFKNQVHFKMDFQ